MLGRNEAERARSLALCSWLASTVHPAFARFVRRKCFSGDEASQAAVRESARQTYWESLQEIDGMLAGKPWLMGDELSLCDPYALVFYGWGLELELPVDGLVNVTEMKDRLLERPLARTALERESSRPLAM